jgi:putative spermidine/putrescine transport system permease protein
MAHLVKPSRRIWLYVLVGLILIFLVMPVFIVIPMSFSNSRYLDFPPPSWSLRWYERLFTAIEWYSALLVSLKLAAASAIIATPIGVAAAYGLHVSDAKIVRAIRGVLFLPLMVPHIVLAIGILYVYARIDVLGSFTGLLVAHVMLVTPFVIITTSAGLRSFDMNQELAARTFGCTRLQAFTKITLPQIKGSVLSGIFFAFVTSLDEVVIAIFVATGANQTITKIMFASLRDESDPTVAAVSTVLIVGSLTVAGLASLPALWRSLRPTADNGAPEPSSDISEFEDPAPIRISG